jgi:hypothetical protein
MNPLNWSDPHLKPEISGTLMAIGDLEKGTWEFEVHTLENHSPFPDEYIKKWVIFNEFSKERGEGKAFIDFLLKMKQLFVSYEDIPSFIIFSSKSEIMFSFDDLSFMIHYFYNQTTKTYEHETYFVDNLTDEQTLVHLSPVLSFSEKFVITQIQKIRIKEVFKKTR